MMAWGDMEKRKPGWRMDRPAWQRIAEWLMYPLAAFGAAWLIVQVFGAAGVI